MHPYADDVQEIALLVKEAKHLPGQHNQLDHGHRYYIHPFTGKRVLKPKIARPKTVADKYAKMNDSQKASYMQKKYAKWEKKLKGNEKEGIRMYTGNTYEYMNTALRSDKVKESIWEDEIKGAASGLLKGKTPHAITVARGVKGGPKAIEDLWNIASSKENVGKTFVDKGFCSTTTQYKANFGRGDGNIQWTIHIPKGAPGGYVQNMSQHWGEQEFLLPPHSRFRFVSTRVDDHGIRHLELDYVGSEWQ